MKQALKPIDELKGRELDRAVAHEVFGVYWTMDEDGWTYLEEAVGDLPAYSTDIAAAWQVVEWFVQRGGEVGIMCDRATDKKTPWRAWISGITRSRHLFGTTDIEMAETAPLAICRAALKAVRLSGGR